MPLNNTHCMQADLTKTGFEKASLETALTLSYNFWWPQHAAEVCPGLLTSATPAASPHPPSFPVLSPPLSSLSVTGTSSSASVLGHWVDRCRESLEVFSQEESVSGGVPLPRARLTDVLTTLHSVVSLMATLQERQDRGGRPMHACGVRSVHVVCVACMWGV